MKSAAMNVLSMPLIVSNTKEILRVSLKPYFATRCIL